MNYDQLMNHVTFLALLYNLYANPLVKDLFGFFLGYFLSYRFGKLFFSTSSTICEIREVKE